MLFKNKLIYSSIVSLGVVIVSIFAPIIPCRRGPAVPNPIYRWSRCTLNPVKIPTSNSINEFLGYTSSIKEAYFLVFIIFFVLSMISLHFLTKHHKKQGGHD